MLQWLKVSTSVMPVTQVAEVAVKRQVIRSVHCPALDEKGKISKTVPAAITENRLTIRVRAGLACFSFLFIIGIFCPLFWKAVFLALGNCLSWIFPACA